MPTQPPRFRAAAQPPAKPWASSSKESRQARGYDRAHEKMRAVVLSEEPLCRQCLEEGRTSATTIADHKVPISQGGTNDRSNYQGLCRTCHDAKTKVEGREGRRRSA